VTVRLTRGRGRGCTRSFGRIGPGGQVLGADFPKANDGGKGGSAARGPLDHPNDRIQLMRSLAICAVGEIYPKGWPDLGMGGNSQALNMAVYPCTQPCPIRDDAASRRFFDRYRATFESRRGTAYMWYGTRWDVSATWSARFVRGACAPKNAGARTETPR